MDERIRIGNRIKELRQKRGISSYRLAEMTGLQRQNISRIESGKYSTGVDILSKIAVALGCNLDFIELELNEKMSYEVETM